MIVQILRVRKRLPCSYMDIRIAGQRGKNAMQGAGPVTFSGTVLYLTSENCTG